MPDPDSFVEDAPAPAKEPDSFEEEKSPITQSGWSRFVQATQKLMEHPVVQQVAHDLWNVSGPGVLLHAGQVVSKQNPNAMKGTLESLANVAPMVMAPEEELGEAAEVGEGGWPGAQQRTLRQPAWKTNPQPTTEVPSILNRQPYAQPARAPRAAPEPAAQQRPALMRVRPKEQPNIGEQRQVFNSGEQALTHYLPVLGEDGLTELAAKRGVPQKEIEQALAQGKEVEGTGEGGRLTGEDIANNLKTETKLDKLIRKVRDTYEDSDELDAIQKRAERFFRGVDQNRMLGKGSDVAKKMVKAALFPEFKGTI